MENTSEDSKVASIKLSNIIYIFNIIVYLSKSKSVISIDKLQTEVWGHQSKLETHTVETHIYRLRKKILKTFNDEFFIISKKNGYQII